MPRPKKPAPPPAPPAPPVPPSKTSHLFSPRKPTERNSITHERIAADLAEKHAAKNKGQIRLSNKQNLIIANVLTENLDPLVKELTDAGLPLGAMSGAARDRWRARHVGFLPQQLHLSQALTVEGNLALA